MWRSGTSRWIPQLGSISMCLRWLSFTVTLLPTYHLPIFVRSHYSQPFHFSKCHNFTFRLVTQEKFSMIEAFLYDPIKLEPNRPGFSIRTILSVHIIGTLQRL